MDFSKLTLDELIRRIDDPRMPAILKFRHERQELFYTSKGSTAKHHAWVGGYADHIAECLRINEAIYEGLNMQLRPLPFSKASAAIALFHHDHIKLVQHATDDTVFVRHWHQRHADSGKSWHDLQEDFIAKTERDYSYKLTEEEKLAIKYAHGEGDMYHPTEIRVPLLSSHVHACDTYSARPYSQCGKGLG